jgi:hypothetical protein
MSIMAPMNFSEASTSGSGIGVENVALASGVNSYSPSVSSVFSSSSALDSAPTVTAFAMEVTHKDHTYCSGAAFDKPISPRAGARQRNLGYPRRRSERKPRLNQSRISQLCGVDTSITRSMEGWRKAVAKTRNAGRTLMFAGVKAHWRRSQRLSVGSRIRVPP